MNFNNQIKKVKKGIKQTIGEALSHFVGFLLNLSFLILLTEEFHIHYLISAAVGFLFATFLTFTLDRKFVFKAKRSYRKEILEFFIVSIVMLGVNLSVLALFTEMFGIFYVYSQIIASAITFFIRFFLNKYWVFR